MAKKSLSTKLSTVSGDNKNNSTLIMTYAINEAGVMKKRFILNRVLCGYVKKRT
jgi:hypothetical protein